MISETNINLIEKLKELTGIPFSIEENELSDQELEQKLNKLLETYSTNQVSASRNTIFLRYLNGHITASEAKSSLHHYHFDTDLYVNLYLLRFDRPYNEDDSVLSILSEFIDRSTSEFLQVSDTELVIVHLTNSLADADSMQDFASQIENTLSSEAMTPVRISFDQSTRDFEALPTSYRNLTLAMEIGMTFYSSDRLYNYHQLGLGKLISSLPNEACESYLKETLPGIDFSSLDSETRNTINTFFSTGLNIAETARLLYLHRNTLVYRLDKFHKTTGLDLRDFDDAVSCKMGMLLTEYLDYNKNM